MTYFLECPFLPLDLIFLLDSSGSISNENFDKVKNWVKLLANNFNISVNSTAIGIIQYSHYDFQK